MKFTRYLRYINKGLSLLIAALFIVTILSTIYLSETLINSRSLIRNGSNTVAGVLVLQDLGLNVQTAEASQKQYIVTGNSEFLKPYEASVKLIPYEQKQLRSDAYGINPKELDKLDSLINVRVRRLEDGIKLFQKQGLDAYVSYLSSSNTLNDTTQIQDLVKKIAQEKLVPFAPTYQRTQNNLHFALLVGIAMVGLVFIIALMIILFFQRAIAKERATEGVKNEFLSLASHQLRTPASNVKQYIGLLLEGYMGKLTLKQKEALEVANKNNDIGINIINDLLDVAKLDLEKINLNKETVNIYKLIKEVVDNYRPNLKERRQTVKFVRTVKKVEAFADPTYMKSVVENLLDNASKYSPKKSKIFIKIDRRSTKAIFSIKDEGMGMKKREMVKLFRKFSRISDELTNNVEGSGLGLYWVKQVVELHGGKVIARSRHGKGSTFTVELPLY